MPLLKNGELVDDLFQTLEDDQALPVSGGVIVGLSRWKRDRDSLIARAGAVGVVLTSDQSPTEIAEDLKHLDLVALDFPAFNNGTSYSSARLLRDRYGYRGEIRAVGDVLLEQLHFLSRVGFDTFNIDSDDPAGDWKIAQADMQLWYQPTGDGRATVRDKRRT